MFNGKTVSVVMPAYNEEKGVGEMVKEFKQSAYVDEVIVVDNNSNDQTAAIAERAGARVVKELKRGYGHACKRALLEAKGENIVLCESDCSFSPKDLLKFLAYSDDFDLIMGTRTSRELIAKSANMYYFMKWGNWFVAKLLQVLYNGPALTDMGCTYRLIKRGALKKIKNHLYVGGSAFLANMTTVALKKSISTIEISVHYKGRKGISKITGSFFKAVIVALSMVGIIFANLFKNYNEK
ncbi:MAG: glycosyltransferase family 2 protein [Candidatus Omnitrophica bacterium]|nr:glycosyltransferase family 2 protein [Candidatus Omnitrophota bacterium]